MGLKCRIKEIEGTKIPMQGNQMDTLYRSLLEYYKDDAMALESWAKANSINSIEELAIFEGDEVTSDLAKFIDQSIGNQEIKVSDREKFDILYLAVTNGFKSLSDFLDKLNMSLKPNGYFDLSPQNLLDSGLFTITDIETVSLDKLVDIVNKTEAIISQGDVEINSTETPSDYYDTSKKNEVGGTKRLTTKEMLDSVLDIAKTDFLSLEEAIEISGFEELKDIVDSDKFEELTIVQEVSPNGDTLDLKFNQSRKVLENTLLTYTSTVDLEADIDFINSFDDDVWNRKAESVYKVTKEIELNLAKKGIDVIGLADRGLSKTELVLFLKTIQNMLENPTSITVDAFYDQLSILNVDFREGNASLKKIFAADSNLDLVEVNSDQSLTDLYKKYGLVVFQGNLFFRVQKESKDILYEKLYNKYTNSGEGIETDSEKAEVLKGLTDLVNTYRSEVDETIREEYNLYKLLSGRAKAESLRVQDIEPLTTVKSDVEYLKGEFISDFNKYVLEEKFANSQIYDRVLRHIKITDAGIVVPDDVTTLMGIKYKQELEDYIKIRRGNFGNHLIEPENRVSFRDRDLYFLNNKQKIREVQTQYRTSGDFLVTKENPNLYIKVGNDIYRKAVSKDQNDLYAKVRANYKDNLFYDTNTNYDTNLEDMFSILETMKLPSTEYKKPALEDIKEEIRYQIIGEQRVQTPTTLQKSFGTSSTKENIRQVIDKLKQTGLAENVFELNTEQLKAKLKELGVSDDIAMQVIAWHGTPYSFDRFTTDKMGTGEGVQAFGWGLYFTDLESIARGYAKNLSENKANYYNNDEKITNESIIAVLKENSIEDNKNYFQAENREGSRIFVDTYNYSETYFENNNGVWYLKSEESLEEEDEEDGYKPKKTSKKADINDFIRFSVRNTYSDMLYKEAIGEEVFNFLENNIQNIVDKKLDKNLYKVSLFKDKTPDQYTWLEWDNLLNDSVSLKLEKALIPSSYKERLDPILKETKRGEILGNIENFINEERISLRQKITNIIVDNNIKVGRGKDPTFYFTGNLSPEIKETISQYMSEQEKELVEDFSKLVKISKRVVKLLTEDFKTKTGKDIYKDLTDYFKYSAKEASLFLLKNGIDGIKFPAESIARGTTSDTARGFNYVVFDENAITIEEQIQFQKALAQQGIDLIPNGFVINKEVYLNSDTIDNSTPVHEFSHLFNKWTKQNRPDIYKRGIELVEQELQKENSEIQDAIDYVKQTQPNLTGERLTEEILTEFVGRYSSQMMDEQKEKSGLMNWLSDFWNSIKEMLGITSMSPEQVANLTLQEYARATVSNLLRGENISAEKAQEYFTRQADRLPLTLAVFENKQFVDMRGKMVNPITVQQSLNQSGIKQIEKDLINQVIADNYQGQKKISYDELETTVRANIMPLERITTSSYADYGMDNLGDGNYGKAKTLILNAPIEHGVTGHFSGDFKATGRQNIKYTAKQLNDNTWVAVEEGYEANANDNNIYQYVGTAGTKEAVDGWIQNYNNNKTNKKFDKTFLESKGITFSRYNKQSFIEKYGEEGWNISEYNDNDIVFEAKVPEAVQDEFDTLNVRQANTSFESLADILGYTGTKEFKDTPDINKGMFGHIRVWQDGDTFYTAELQSDYFQKQYVVEDMTQQVVNSDKYSFTTEQRTEYNAIFRDMVKYRRTYFEQRDDLKDEYKNDLSEATKEELETLETYKKNYEEKKAQYEKTVVSKAKPLFEKDQKQFTASQKVWEQRMVREAIKEASLSGATSLRFPTPYTLSVIEMYIEVGDNSARPYTVVRGDSSFLVPGDLIVYVGEPYIIVENNDEEITIVSEKKVRIEKDDSNWNKDLSLQNVDVLINRDLLYLYYKQSDTERISLYSGIQGPSKESFSIEDDLSQTQQTVARKYEEIAEILKKERGDNFEVVTDENGFDWYETKIEVSETQNPVVAFQKSFKQDIEATLDSGISFQKDLDDAINEKIENCG